MRLAAGAAYSLLTSTQSNYEVVGPSNSLDASGGAVSFVGISPVYPMVFEKNQLQLFSEVAYVRDLGSRFSISAGGQFHYYPFNLLESSSLRQHMFTLGAKVAARYNF